MTRKKKNGLIEFLRFAFCLIIVFRHGAGFTPESMTEYFQRGALGVEFFFLISGYLMACSAAKYQTNSAEGNNSVGKDTVEFLKRKISGLCPELPIAFLISFLISFCSLGSFSVGRIIEAANEWIWECLMVSMAGFSTGSMHMGIWYISAMLLSMLILFPLCRKYFDTFVRVIAPIIAIFLIGILVLMSETTLGPTHILGGFVYKGMVRAIAEMSLGIACYLIIEHLRKYNLTRFAQILIDIIMLFLMAGIFTWMIFGDDEKYDLLCFLLITITVCLAFSHQGYFAKYFDCKIFYWLGEISFAVYLGHVEWSKAITGIYIEGIETGIYGADPRHEFLIMNLIYISLIICTVFIIKLFAKWYYKNKDRIVLKIRTILVEDESVI